MAFRSIAINITNNVFTTGTSTGSGGNRAIYVRASNQTIVTNNSVWTDIIPGPFQDYVFYGVLVATESYHNSIVNNSIQACVWGIACCGEEFKSYQGGYLVQYEKWYPRYTIIKNNTISDCSTDGIYLVWAEHSWIAGNVVSRSTSHGIKIDRCADQVLESNGLYSNGGYGIWINGSQGTTTRNNTFAGNALGEVYDPAVETFEWVAITCGIVAVGLVFLFVIWRLRLRKSQSGSDKGQTK